MEQHGSDLDYRQLWEKNAGLLWRGRLLFCLIWAVLIFAGITPIWDGWPVGVLIVFPVFDFLAFVFYDYVIEHFPRRATIATVLSISLTTLGITLSAHLASDYTWAGVLLYILLVVVMPFAGAGLIASLTTFGYLLLVVGELSGLLSVAASKSIELQSGVWSVPFVLAGIWVSANLMQRVFVLVVQRWKEQIQLTDEARRRVEAERIWSTVGKTVTATQDLDEVLTTVIQVINEKLQVETGSILLRVAGTDDLVFAKILHGNVEQFASIRLHVGQGIVGWVAQTGQSAIVPDTAIDKRWFDGVDRRTGFSTRSVICVPLVTKGETIGVIELLNKKEGTFTAADLHILESIAAPVAIAIQNARLHRQVHDQLNELTQLFHQVQRAKEEWENTIDAINEGILLVDEHCQILRVNRPLADWLHTTPAALVGKHCYQVIHGVDTLLAQCPHAQAMADPDHVHQGELENSCLGGTFHVTVYPLKDRSGKVAGMVNVFRNITTEKLLQAQLIRSENMAATGRLAASLAHEINNPLQAIQGCLEIVQANWKEREKQQRYLQMAQGEIGRLSTLVRRMLDFNRPAEGHRVLLDMHLIIDDVLALTSKRLQSANVAVELDRAADLPSVRGVSNQLKQVFLNLVLNAIEAMPQGGKLQITIQERKEENDWLTIALTDSGVGIPADAIDKIFEPFYTTKVSGTGLGLGVTHNIVTSHGGRLTVESVIGQGSTFTVWLPV